MAAALDAELVQLDTDRAVVGASVWCPDDMYSVLLRKK